MKKIFLLRISTFAICFLLSKSFLAQTLEVRKSIIGDTVTLKGVLTMELRNFDNEELSFFTNVPDSFASYRKWNRFRKRKSSPVLTIYSVLKEDSLLKNDIRRLVDVYQPCDSFRLIPVLDCQILFESFSERVRKCFIEGLFLRAKILDKYLFQKKGKFRYDDYLILVCTFPGSSK